MDFKMYFFLFLIYAMMGWCMEVSWGFIRTKKLVNRGFLVGPYCPIYGWGGVLITLALSEFTEYPFAIFCSSIVICGVLEYLTSFVMEKLFKARWWDYKNRKFNINGRVCLETIIPFGLLSCMILYITNPFFIGLLGKLTEENRNILFLVGLVVFLTDTFVSFTVISKLRSTVKQVNKNEMADNTEEITKKVREILLGKSFLERRLIKAFPKISIEDVKKRIKETTEHVKENVAKATEAATEYVKENVAKATEMAAEHIRDSAAQVKENTIRVKDEVAERIKNKDKEK